MSEQTKSPLAAATANGQSAEYEMNRKQYITARARAQMMAILAAAVGILIGTFIGLQLVARGEENRLTEAWVLCQPDSYVNIRERASSRSAYAGMLMSGDQIWVDGRTKDGYAHCENMSNELGEGWVHAGYIVFEEPEEVNRQCRISSNGRVSCRRSIDGDRRCWVVDGSEVFVYQVAGEWAVTDKGFIMTEFISGID